jgi:hypothetical protein
LDITAERTLNLLYTYLDIAWLVVYAGVLLWKRRYPAAIAGVIGGAVYFAVDYGIFYLGLGTRVVRGADPFWFLLWLSTSYGFTNIAWIWLMLDRDGHGREWTVLTISGWVVVAFLGQTLGTGFPAIAIARGTNAYHGAMALILLAGYLFLIIRNLRAPSREKVNLLWLLAIGIGVQFGWESVLVISGIRPAGVMPLIINSLLETNMGMPYFYLIHKAFKRRVANVA